MFVRKLPYIIYRAYPTKGYLTDNRNFGYDTAAKSCLKVGDLLISHGGSIFYSQLEDEYRCVDEIARKLTTIFTGVGYDVLLKDATVFYTELAKKGFIECVEDLDAKSLRYFSYDNYKPCIIDAEINAPVEYNEVFSGEYSLTRIHVDISSRCNENCVHCYIPVECKRGMMDEDMFDKVLNQCVDMKIINITLSGGEPMLNPHLTSFLIKCREANLSVNILSNLTCLSDELLDVIASNPLICIQTSVYAMDADVPKDLLSDVYYKLYHLAWVRENKENAFKFAEKAAELQSCSEGKLQIYSNLATNALQRNLLDEANQYVEKCVGLLSENTPNAWYVCYLKGKIQLKKGDQKAALEEFTSSAKEANRMHLPYGEIAVTIYVAEVLFQLGLKNNALSEIARIEMYAKRTRQLQQYLRVLIKKAQLLYRVGRKDEAEQVVLTIPEFDD